MQEEGSLAKISRRALVYALVAVIGVSLIVGGALYNYAESRSAELDEIKERLKRVEEQVRTTAVYAVVGNITLRFEAYMPVQTVPESTITYLIGFVTLSNLTKIVARPITVNVYFEPTVKQSGNGTINYDYTPFQTLDIAAPGLNEVFIPWSAFPIRIENFHRGDVIDWIMNITAQAEWMTYPVTQTSLTVSYRFIVI